MDLIPPFTLQSLPKTCAANRELVEKILANFRHQVVDHLTRLTRCIQNNDPTGAEQWAHALSRAAGAVAADPLRTLAAQLESIAREGSLSATESQLKELQNEAERCIAYIPIAAQRVDLNGKGRGNS